MRLYGKRLFLQQPSVSPISIWGWGTAKDLGIAWAKQHREKQEGISSALHSWLQGCLHQPLQRLSVDAVVQTSSELVSEGTPPVLARKPGQSLPAGQDTSLFRALEKSSQGTKSRMHTHTGACPDTAPEARCFTHYATMPFPQESSPLPLAHPISHCSTHSCSPGSGIRALCLDCNLSGVGNCVHHASVQCLVQ